MAQRKMTAPEAYRARLRDVERLLDMLKDELAHHAEYAARQPRDWGYAGDLGHMRDLLKGAMVSLSQQGPRDIERRLKSAAQEGR